MKTSNANYIERRSEIENYFDRTAAKAWERLTSNAPVGRIRASVRAGRDEMRNTLLGWLPQDMRGLRLLDAGCGTGALALEAMQRGAEVVAIDLSPTLVQLGRERNATLTPNGRGGSITYLSGDMLDDALGEFDHVVAMDSVIHYDTPDIANAIQRLAGRTRGSVLFTIAPSSPLLSVAHAMGRFFPRSDRSPALTPVSQARLRALLLQGLGGSGWTEGRTQRVSGGFYTSQAWEWTR
ncbi:magnesium protoporphyrin O-methyltransferase [Hydrogenophaga sp. RAC07]|uniref:magnesium protoporphyrin IX methyltransferase n=1 Tax=Hydrogenophaga sp. RAC07 TaxID=1842537 RepID=UPI00083DE143|nr:magnesium protoporphyrin IX methyltransferase [Hydrogenophaga sp. RAC07]AOF87164.1 magnesium protoporphyrin O-methyltransferase [Hydrogenophaga sp. RAC07]